MPRHESEQPRAHPAAEAPDPEEELEVDAIGHTRRRIGSAAVPKAAQDDARVAGAPRQVEEDGGVGAREAFVERAEPHRVEDPRLAPDHLGVERGPLVALRSRVAAPAEEIAVHDGEAQPAVEVELRPAGKRITRLSLLSGGEKALGAISFLFALFLARPCPFYLLDEVEAALDDTNIGRFVELLRRYADRAQFVVITHQKRTMEAADVLYGVTMGADGVSQIVSRRLPQEDRAALATA